MGALFDKFVKMAKDEFGYTIIQDSETPRFTFKDIFGVSLDDFEKFKVPYEMAEEKQRYYDAPETLAYFDSKKEFVPDDYVCLAA